MVKITLILPPSKELPHCQVEKQETAAVAPLKERSLSPFLHFQKNHILDCMALHRGMLWLMN